MKDIHSFEPFWGDWYIERELGHGSYGTVYLARKKDPKRIYYAAIKHIPIPADTQETKALYEGGYATNQATVQAYYEQMVNGMMAEIDACYALKGHTNIVSYEEHDIIPRVGEPGFDILIKMEYLTPLGDYIIGRALTVEDVVRMGEDICTALMVLQRKQFVHRDIKPGNVFINDVGDFKLGDFGVARTLERTMSGMSEKGTYEFMAPEVRQGGDAGYQVDIYSLGIMMYKLLNSNRGPFLPLPPVVPTYGQTEEARQRRFSGEIIPPPAHGEDEIKKIVLKACAFNKDERWTDATEMKAALAAYRATMKPEQAGEVVLNYERGSLSPQGTIGDGDRTELLMGVASEEETALLPAGEMLNDEPTPRMAPKSFKAEEEKAPPPRQKRASKAIPFVIGGVAAVAVTVGALALWLGRTPPSKPYDPAVDGIKWGDASVEAAVRKWTNHLDTPIFASDLERIERVTFAGAEAVNEKGEATNWGISESNQIIIETESVLLNDLEQFPNAKTIDFFGLASTEEISGWDTLQDMKHLQELNISSVDKLDLTTIAQLDYIKKLTILQEPEGTNWEQLGSMAGLEYLQVGYSDLTDISFVSNLKNLSELHVADNQVKDITPIGNLTHLSALDIGRNQIADIGAVAALENLAFLYADGNKISDVSAISTLKNLLHLNLERNQISDVTPLAQLNEACSINLQENPIVNWTPIERIQDVSGRPDVVGSFTFDKQNMALVVGETGTLVVAISPEGFTANLQWGVSDPTVISVSDNGIVTALGEGAATVTLEITETGYAQSCAVQVSAPQENTPPPSKSPKPSAKPSASPKPSKKPAQSTPPAVSPVAPPSTPSEAPSVAPPPEPENVLVVSVSMSTRSVILGQGSSTRLSASVSPANATNTHVSWSSSNHSVATVDGSGNVTAKGSGTTIITASCGGYQATCAVTVE